MLPKRLKKILFLAAIAIFLTGLLWKQEFKNPVIGASKSDYNPDSFWYYPWGRSVTHKGVDIFAKKGTPLRSSTKGIVLFSGEIDVGGRVLLILGPKWRLHYYAHLDSIYSKTLSMVTHSTTIGTVGNSGNAIGKPPHLHYSIITPLPYFWRIDTDRQGWKKMFFLNPIDYL